MTGASHINAVVQSKLIVETEMTLQTKGLAAGGLTMSAYRTAVSINVTCFASDPLFIKIPLVMRDKNKA